MIKLSKKVLGKKLRTGLVPHRISVKAYENGVVIKPIGGMGIPLKKHWKKFNILPLKKHWKKFNIFNCIEEQEPIFLTNECVEYLQSFYETVNTAKKITEELDKLKCPNCQSEDCYRNNLRGKWNIRCNTCGTYFIETNLMEDK